MHAKHKHELVELLAALTHADESDVRVKHLAELIGDIADTAAHNVLACSPSCKAACQCDIDYMANRLRQCETAHGIGD